VSAQPSIPDRVYFRIGDVAEIAGIKPHVLRYWETEFSEITPEKSASGQRVYRRRTVETVLLIKKLLYQDRYSIDGARRRLRELRRDGQLASECREAAEPLPASERDARAQALAGARRVLADLEALNQRPIRDSYRY
jgi:DNA-binding transcriptional MerR regulator